MPPVVAVAVVLLPRRAWVLLENWFRLADPATLASSDDPLPPAATVTSVAGDVAAIVIEPAVIVALLA